jgi:hypothetical protein
LARCDPLSFRRHLPLIIRKPSRQGRPPPGPNSQAHSLFIPWGTIRNPKAVRKTRVCVCMIFVKLSHDRKKGAGCGFSPSGLAGRRPVMRQWGEPGGRCGHCRGASNLWNGEAVP